MNPSFYSSLIVCVALTACSSDDAVNIGEDQPARIGYALEDYAGSWDGYAEGHRFPSGSDRVRLQLSSSGEGVLELGDVPLFDPTTELEFDDGSSVDESATALMDGWTKPGEGFRYPVHGTALTNNRIQLGVEPKEPYKGWCELQTPVSRGNDGTDDPEYGCFYNTSVRRSGSTCTYGDDDEPVDCLLVNLCKSTGQPCTCTSASCSVDVATELTELRHVLDGVLEDEGASFVGTFGGVTVRLERQ